MKKDLQQRQYWLEHYQHWQVSGLTQEVYCRKVKICFDHFRRWRCALIKSGDIVKPSNDKQPKEFKPLIISSSPDLPTERSIATTNTEGRTEIELALPGGVKLSLRSFA